jgi:hypothetical protein
MKSTIFLQPHSDKVFTGWLVPRPAFLLHSSALADLKET